jgi:tetratricopeptide (TPR) repeat protein
MLRHLPFFEVLGDTEEGSADWRSISAGLLVLRLFDSWVDYGHEIVTTDMTGLRAIRDAVDAIDETDPTRELLRSVVDTMWEAETVDVHAIAPKWLAYARALDHRGKWSLAADVLRNTIESLDVEREPDLLYDANMHLGYVSRTIGEWDEAQDAYQEAERLALRVSSMAKQLRAHIGLAMIVQARGNLPKAEQLLDRVIVAANEGGFDEVRALALQDRGGVAFHRGNYKEAIRFYYDALPHAKSAASHDRILFDIAGSFQALGAFDTARDAFVVLAARAQEQYLRWTATANLMEIASHEGFEVLFDQYRRELDHETLPVSLNAAVKLVVGQSFHRFGRYDEAERALRGAIEFATAHKLNQLVFQAESSLADVLAGARATQQVTIAAPEEVDDVAFAIRGIREKAGV